MFFPGWRHVRSYAMFPLIPEVQQIAMYLGICDLVLCDLAEMLLGSDHITPYHMRPGSDHISQGTYLRAVTPTPATFDPYTSPVVPSASP